MYDLIVALTTLVVLCFLMLGVIIGFLVTKIYPPAPRLHPEMYNRDGSIRPDILYAVTFDQNYDDDEDYTEDSETD